MITTDVLHVLFSGYNVIVILGVLLAMYTMYLCLG